MKNIKTTENTEITEKDSLREASLYSTLLGGLGVLGGKFITGITTTLTKGGR